MPRKRRVVLTERDVEIFHWLWLLRVLTLGQIRRLAYYHPDTGQLSVLDNVRKRLRRLWDAGYISGTRLVESKERLYTLDDNALAPLRETYGIDQWRLYKPKLAVEAQLLHPLMVSECVVRIVESTRASSFQLAKLRPTNLPFVLTHTIADPQQRRHVERFVSQENVPADNGGDVHRIRPDLVFGLGKGDRQRLYFLEADRSTENPQLLVEKQLAYAAYFSAADPKHTEQRLWQRYGNMGDFRVLLVTTTERRAKSLVTALEPSTGWELLAVTTLEQFEKQNPIFDPIWTNQAGKGRQLARR